MGNGFDVYNFAGGFRFYDAVSNDKAFNKKSTLCGMDDEKDRKEKALRTLF